MPTETMLDPIRSGRWPVTLPNGLAGEFRIDTESRRWSLDLWRGSPAQITGQVLT